MCPPPRRGQGNTNGGYAFALHSCGYNPPPLGKLCMMSLQTTPRQCINCVRFSAWIRDDSPLVYKVSTYKQCDDHVTNLVRTLFNRKVVQSFEHHGLTYLVCTKNTGGKLAMHYQLTCRPTKQVLTFKRAKFANLKAEQDTREGKPDHGPPLQRTSFKRFATFGTYMQAIQCCRN